MVFSVYVLWWFACTPTLVSRSERTRTAPDAMYARTRFVRTFKNITVGITRCGPKRSEKRKIKCLQVNRVRLCAAHHVPRGRQKYQNGYRSTGNIWIWKLWERYGYNGVCGDGFSTAFRISNSFPVQFETIDCFCFSIDHIFFSINCTIGKERKKKWRVKKTSYNFVANPSSIPKTCTTPTGVSRKNDFRKKKNCIRRTYL
jgi:hypothetical protein